MTTPSCQLIKANFGAVPAWGLCNDTDFDTTLLTMEEIDVLFFMLHVLAKEGNIFWGGANADIKVAKKKSMYVVINNYVAMLLSVLYGLDL